MLEFTLTAKQSQLLGVMFDVLDAKAVKGQDLYSATYLRWDNERLTALVTDRYAMARVIFDHVIETGLTRPCVFTVSPAQSKALKAAKQEARLTYEDGLATVTIGSVVISHTMTNMERNGDKLLETVAPIIDAALVAGPYDIVAKVDAARIGRLAKLSDSLVMRATGKNKPLVFQDGDIVALVQPKRD